MAKEKKLGLKFEFAKNKKDESDKVYVRVTYNGSNTKLQAPFVRWGPITRTKGGFISMANDIDFVEKQDTPLFMKVKEAYDILGITYQATDFTYTSDRFLFLCNEVDSAFEKFLGDKLSEHLLNQGLYSTGSFINRITLPLDLDSVVSMIRELNVTVYEEIETIVTQHLDIIKYFKIEQRKSTWVYNPVANVICSDDISKPNHWKEFKDYLIEKFKNDLRYFEF